MITKDLCNLQNIHNNSTTAVALLRAISANSTVRFSILRSDENNVIDESNNNATNCNFLRT